MTKDPAYWSVPQLCSLLGNDLPEFATALGLGTLLDEHNDCGTSGTTGGQRGPSTCHSLQVSWTDDLSAGDSPQAQLHRSSQLNVPAAQPGVLPFVEEESFGVLVSRMPVVGQGPSSLLLAQPAILQKQLQPSRPALQLHIL